MKRDRRIHRRAFTIVEMMVTVAVVGVILSIIFPAVGMVRRQAGSVSCQSNLRQLHGAWEIYRTAIKGMLPMCDFLPASTPDGPVGGLPEVLAKTLERDCSCWYCVSDSDEKGSRMAGTSYFYVPGLLRYSPQVQIQVGALMIATAGEPMSERQRERRRREAESKLVGALYDRSPREFAILTDSQDRHVIGDRNPRNAVYIDGSVGILRDVGEEEEEGG
jgi:prepilin-type N-terminal cleavage/methylation domain-containing protein